MTLSFGVFKVQGHQVLGLSSFGAVKFWGCQVLGFSSFRVVEFRVTVLSLISAPGALQIERNKPHYFTTLISTSHIYCYVNMGRNKGGALIRGRAVNRNNTVIGWSLFGCKHWLFWSWIELQI